MTDLIEHNCPIEGEMLIEKDKPCDWCDELDEEEDGHNTETV